MAHVTLLHVLSLMIKVWMKNHLISDNIYNVVKLHLPICLSRKMKNNGRFTSNHGWCTIRSISHMRVKVYDHCMLRSLIGQEGQDRPSSLRTRR